MKDFTTYSVLEEITYSIEFQIRKHGNYCGAISVEDAVNQLTNFELLELIAEHLESKPSQEYEVKK